MQEELKKQVIEKTRQEITRIEKGRDHCSIQIR